MLASLSKRFFVLLVCLLGLASAQMWEYAVLTVSIDLISQGTREITLAFQDSSDVDVYKRGITTMPARITEEFFTELLAQVDVERPAIGGLTGILNVIGALGWELVAVHTTGSSAVYTFKRQRT
jgi:hypothetical protein